MRLEIRMPRLSEFSDEGTIAKWRVEVGDIVKKGDVVAEVDVDMSRTEILAQADGKIVEIWVYAGQAIPVETVIAMMAADEVAIIDEPVAEEPQQEAVVAEIPVEESEDDFEVFPELGDETTPYVEPGSESAVSEDSAGDQYGSVLASPEAIALAEQHNINLETLIGIGTSGRIERADVQAAMQANSQFITPEDVDDLMNFDGDFASTMPSDQQSPTPETADEPEPAVFESPEETQPAQADADDVTTESAYIEVEVSTEETAAPIEEAAEASVTAEASPNVIYMGAGPEADTEPEALAIDESDTISPEDDPADDSAAGEEPVDEPEPTELDAATVEQIVDQSVNSPDRKSVKVRRLVARKMEQSWQQAPHFFVTVAVDMTDVIRFRTDLGVTINDFILTATTRALQEHPWVNSHFVDDEAVEQADINISMAVETEQGLYYPVVKGCAGKAVKELGISAAEMVVKAHSGKLTEEDMEGGSFTISNMGMLGVESFGAIITPPQVAVLAVGTVRGEVIIDEYEEMAMAPMVRLTLSGDHRALDGADAADFLGTMKSYLEAPITLVASQDD